MLEKTKRADFHPLFSLIFLEKVYNFFSGAPQMVHTLLPHDCIVLQTNKYITSFPRDTIARKGGTTGGKVPDYHILFK